MASPISPASSPISSVRGVAASSEASTSRPCVSLPSQCAALGGRRGGTAPMAASEVSTINGASAASRPSSSSSASPKASKGSLLSSRNTPLTRSPVQTLGAATRGSISG